MSRFEEANQRLLDALDRLERAAERRPSNGAGDEVGALREALDNSRRANAALRGSRDVLAIRLDSAIDRLKTVLGEE